MRVDDTWILVDSFDDLYINLGWFIKWRPFGMSIGDTLNSVMEIWLSIYMMITS